MSSSRIAVKFSEKLFKKILWSSLCTCFFFQTLKYILKIAFRVQQVSMFVNNHYFYQLIKKKFPEIFHFETQIILKSYVSEIFSIFLRKTSHYLIRPM